MRTLKFLVEKLSSSRSSAGDLLIRSHPCGHPDPFRSVRDLGRAAARCSGESGELEGRSSAWLPAWLPAAHYTGHRDALVLVTNIGPSTGEGTATCPAQTPPPNPTAAGPGDGRVRSRPSWRVHEPCNSPDAVVLRPQTVLTGSGSHRYSYGGSGEDTHTSTRITAAKTRSHQSLHCQLGKSVSLDSRHLRTG